LGGGGGGAAPAYTPASDPLTRLWWDPSQLADGAVASWLDRIAGVDATQGTGTKQPVRSGTGIGGAYPGVTSDGGDVLVAAGAGAILSGKTLATVTAGFFDSEAGATAKMLWEYGTNVTTVAGSAAGFVNDAGASRVCGGTKGGAVGSTIRFGSDTAATFAVWSWVINLSIAGAGQLVAIRKNGVAVSLTSASATATAGAFASDSLHLFGRGTTPTIGIIATLGHFVVRESASEDVALFAAEQFVAAQGGLVI
jgi:hypothetical protein